MLSIKHSSKRADSISRHTTSEFTQAELNVLKSIGYKELEGKHKSEVIKKRLNEAWEMFREEESKGVVSKEQ